MSEHEADKAEDGTIRASDLTAQRPGDKPTAWQRAHAERQAERETEPEPDPLTEAKRAELIRCAAAFEHTAAKLREIVGHE